LKLSNFIFKINKYWTKKRQTSVVGMVEVNRAFIYHKLHVYENLNLEVTAATQHNKVYCKKVGKAKHFLDASQVQIAGRCPLLLY
jgi:hypothetical protein